MPIQLLDEPAGALEDRLDPGVIYPRLAKALGLKTALTDYLTRKDGFDSDPEMAANAAL